MISFLFKTTLLGTIALGLFYGCKSETASRQSHPEAPTSRHSDHSDHSDHSHHSDHSDRSDRTTHSEPTTKLEIFQHHVDLRFDVLKRILKKDKRFVTLFPGSKAEKHFLGAGIAQGSWGNTDGPKITQYITKKIQDLESTFPKQVLFGMIGDFSYDSKTKGCNRNKKNTKAPSPGWDPSKNKFTIHIWGANQGNFNYPQGTKGPWGGGQATCFSHQRPGVFGISTMPSTQKTTLFANDLLEKEYKIP